MAADKSQRIKSLSTRYLGFYKNSVLVILIGVVGFIVFANIMSSIQSGRLQLNNWFTTGYFLFFVYLWIRMNRNVHRVEFDHEFLYVIQKGQDILIPLENIKEVDIKTLGGVYEVELFQPEQLGKKFYFKPSLLYPFNFKKKDELVNVLRRNINRAYQKKQEFQRNALHS
jgi:signal transduction histidine kinase